MRTGMYIRTGMALAALLSVLGGGLTEFTSAARIKDITNVEGVHTNELSGLGLVAGLNGTGGTGTNTRELSANLMQKFGLRLDSLERLGVRRDTQVRTQNLSVVLVSTRLPAFSRVGSTLDVTVSAFDDAQSLAGGTLVQTPLIGLDRQVYAIASGPVSTASFSFAGQAAEAIKNHPTVGRIPNGATVKQEIPCHIDTTNPLHLLLTMADFGTAQRIATAINQVFPRTAHTIDAGTVQVHIPLQHQTNPVGFIAAIGALQVEPDAQAKVVINERTGTIVIGQNVTLSPVAVTHANLSVVTGERPEVSQPEPFRSGGETVVVPRTDLEVVEENNPITMIDEPATVGDLARALNALGVTPRDLSAIFQQLKEVGALHAHLEFK